MPSQMKENEEAAAIVARRAQLVKFSLVSFFRFFFFLCGGGGGKNWLGRTWLIKCKSWVTVNKGRMESRWNLNISLCC